MESHIEYFVPRSVSEFNLSGVGDIAMPPQTSRRSPMSHTHTTSTILFPIQPQQQQQQQPPMQMQQQPMQTTLQMMQMQQQLQQKPREKMVTFEDESKCPHGVPTTPRKGPIVGDIFM